MTSDRCDRSVPLLFNRSIDQKKERLVIPVMLVTECLAPWSIFPPGIRATSAIVTQGLLKPGSLRRVSRSSG